MDVLNITSSYRTELCTWIQTYLKGDAYLWSRKVISDINHTVVSMDKDYVAAQAILMYRNFIRFFNDHCDEVTGSNILFTLYICAIELGVRDFGDDVEQLPEFKEIIEEDDWKQMDKEHVHMFDMRQAAMLINKYYGVEREEADDSNRVWGGGLYTLQTIDFLEV